MVNKIILLQKVLSIIALLLVIWHLFVRNSFDYGWFQGDSLVIAVLLLTVIVILSIFNKKKNK